MPGRPSSTAAQSPTAYVHREARIAETVIAGVLVAGLLATVVRPRLVRAVGLAVQGVALLGTLVGIAMIIAGAGPQSALDLVYHLTIAAVLVIGLCSVSRVCTPES